ncbi:hypothetical protein S245_025161 [Arachis hypogaea]|nr:EPIDERMAL PATTERNING FACTOR-like protein 8 [Arachis hypogaea]XP_025673284.1 EPIDERMAL PATTERNING FACTOR-like protein 8 [Arachis hypogaea]QHN94596.1 EPIDERMAL PATTERNING FACTOR-like protein [Arachis hypogaea]
MAPHGFKLAIFFTVAFIFSLTLLLPISGDAGGRSLLGEDESNNKAVIGSRPPACVDKCMKCRPCMATVIVPNHRRSKGLFKHDDNKDDSYYLLSWRCTCGNKLFHP